MNQRTGKSHRAALGDGMADMKLKLFFRDCAAVLDENGHGDAAFYFEQVVDHLRDGGSLPKDKREAEKVLGL